MSERETEQRFLTKCESPAEWKRIGAVIQTLVEEATFDVNSEGIMFRAMDPSHVALIDIVWPASEFKQFECKKADSFTVRVEDFVKLLRRAQDKDSIQISREGSDSLVIHIENGYKRDFELHLIEGGQHNTPLPKLSYDSMIAISKATFRKALDDISTIANHITFETTKESLVISGKGDAGKVTILLVKEDLVGPIVCEKETRSTYNVEYLAKIDRAIGENVDTLEMHYSTKMPLKLSYGLGEKGTIQLYLAPRVQD